MFIESGGLFLINTFIQHKMIHGLMNISLIDYLVVHEKSRKIIDAKVHRDVQRSDHYADGMCEKKQ